MIIVITALLVVFPDITKILLLTTSSSFGLSTVKKIDGRGVGEGETIEIILLVGATVFVA